MESSQLKELLYCWVASGLHVLVPKRRGMGFLKTPYGHHLDRGLDAIADAAHVDVTGLDGALCFECSGKIYHGGKAARDAFAAVIVPRLQTHYGWNAREVDETEFWRLYPVPVGTVAV